MRKGDIVEVRFFDHVEDGEPIEFVVYGRVGKLTRKFVTIQCWAYPDTLDDDHNVKAFSIVRSCITGVRVLHML